MLLTLKNNKSQPYLKVVTPHATLVDFELSPRIFDHAQAKKATDDESSSIQTDYYRHRCQLNADDLARSLNADIRISTTRPHPRWLTKFNQRIFGHYAQQSRFIVQTITASNIILGYVTHLPGEYLMDMLDEFRDNAYTGDRDRYLFNYSELHDSALAIGHLLHEHIDLKSRRDIGAIMITPQADSFVDPGYSVSIYMLRTKAINHTMLDYYADERGGVILDAKQLIAVI